MSELQTMPLRFRVWDDKMKRFFILDDLMPGLEEPARSDTRLNLSELLELQKQFGKVRITSTRFAVSQDTGLVDKNDKPIFTGDIVKCWDEELGEVYYDSLFLQLRVKYNDGDDEDLASCEPEIVGNIWEGVNNE